MNIGWIKLHRQFKDWEWYNKSEMVHLFIHCLIKSNFKEGNFQGIEVEKGSFITSIKHLSDETNISIQTVRTCLKKLQLTKEIDVKSIKLHFSAPNLLINSSFNLLPFSSLSVAI